MHLTKNVKTIIFGTQASGVTWDSRSRLSDVILEKVSLSHGVSAVAQFLTDWNTILFHFSLFFEQLIISLVQLANHIYFLILTHLSLSLHSFAFNYKYSTHKYHSFMLLIYFFKNIAALMFLTGITKQVCSVDVDGEAIVTFATLQLLLLILFL